jgi:hypothetical protein
MPIGDTAPTIGNENFLNSNYSTIYEATSVNSGQQVQLG